MTFQKSISTCFQKYADFNGRGSRSEYWWFYLFFILAYFVLFFLSATLSEAFRILFALFPLAMLLPSLAAAVRRLHDTNKSGWMVLIGIIPLVNLLLIYFMAQPGDAAENRYGEAPAK